MMKKILLLCLMLILAVILCSCNSDKQEILSDNETKAFLSSLDTEESYYEETAGLDVTTETEVHTTSLTTEETTGLDVTTETEVHTTGITTEETTTIDTEQKDLRFISSLKCDFFEEQFEKSFSFAEKSYTLKSTRKYVYYNLDGTIRYMTRVYRNKDVYFEFVEDSNRLIKVTILNSGVSRPNNQTVTEADIDSLSDSFMEQYAVPRSMEGFVKTIQHISSMDKFRVAYTLYLGGCEVNCEEYIVIYDNKGNLYAYSDYTTGLYDKFIGKVTEEDIEDAKMRAFSYLPFGNDYSEPYLQIGTDGNLYVHVSCFVEGDIGPMESMSFARVYYEE